MRLLIVSYHYAPALSPRAFRWHAIARWWVGQGHAVNVVCAAHGGSPAEQVLDGVAIRRVGGALDRWRGRLAPPATAAASPTQGSGGLRRAAKWLHDQTWRRVYWPDHAAPWYGAARATARQWLTAQPHDALITVALPFTAHRVGLACRDLVPAWLADSGDPFSLNLASPPNNLALYDGRNRRAEARVLAACDRFAVTTAATRERYVAAFPAARPKIGVIPPLAALAAADRSARSFFPADGRRHLAYLGNLYPRIREPGPFLDLLRRVVAQDAVLADKTAVHFFGAAGAFADALATFAASWPGFHLHGTVDRDTVTRVLSGADGLINFGNATEDQLPSKLVEYAAAGKPILNVAARGDDPSAAFLATYPLAVTLVPRDGVLPLEPFRGFLRDVAGGQVDAAIVNRFLAPYSVERVADAYLQALGAAAPAGLAA